MNGPASSVIVLVAPGVDKTSDLDDLLERARRSKIRIASVTYPGVLRNFPLDHLATSTGKLATISQ